MTTLAAIALLAWLWLALLHGGFWRDGERLAPGHPPLEAATPAPSIAIVVPARDEAAVIGRSIASLLAQDYPGRVDIVLVDDGSSDGTGAIARALPGAPDRLNGDRLHIVTGAPRPPGWAGKLWALRQGIARTEADILLLTDADIEHDPAHLATLVAQMQRSGADLVSEMVELNCRSAAERALVPAFVYLFAMLYPFAWVNDPLRATAAAAGGTMLIRRRALARIGGIEAIRGALIDDVTLAAAVKRGGRIWLGHSRLARSIRLYPGVGDIWRMVARSAYVQLRYSPVLLAGTVLGLALLFLAPPVTALAWGSLLGWAAWALMAATFVPTLRRFHLSLAWAPLLPAIALFYMAATIGSAINHHRGAGVVWKSRAYAEGGA